MSTLNDYLAQKRQAALVKKADAESGRARPVALKAEVTAEGRSGVRRMRIRGHEILSDSPPDFAGYDFGPSSPELQLGVLGTCVTHTFLIQASLRQVPLEALRVEVTGQIDPRAGQPGFEQVPVWPHDLGYVVHIDSPASGAEIDALLQAVEKVCPILNLLKNPQTLRAQTRHTRGGQPVTAENAHAAA